jgi:hypothetical protein
MAHLARSTPKRRSNPERRRVAARRAAGGFIVNPRFRRGTDPRDVAAAFRADFGRLAFGTSAALNVRQLANTLHEEEREMKLTNALAIALATMLTASAAHAASLQDTQAPRAAGVHASRDDRVEAPRDRDQDIQAPRGHDAQSPR